MTPMPARPPLFYRRCAHRKVRVTVIGSMFFSAAGYPDDNIVTMLVCEVCGRELTRKYVSLRARMKRLEHLAAECDF
ncbi:MAG: hypothetical protein CO094_05715 [Anaerolineae bacterium CG_4_9_14_3_um_filter_57_17]|nr:hypothetical protein [bacterium]NCT19753.1 hypothetical protein [bacterium]OIO85184.1 MAG: hypothetical protein AUK01_06800 [Anaerolineae bacterium CG2_30_57_67]PJB66918.1 MAG: hypothetical protein CO094_05715 [Anaerolineae bacterium CG_4_9_14_3_um_filter_57_17]